MNTASHEAPVPFTRRRFLKVGAAASLLGASSFPALSAAAESVPRRTRPIAPGAKIRLAFVGLGGMGKQQVERFLQTGAAVPAAFCDVDWRPDAGARNAATLIKTHPDVPRYFDFRKMLQERHAEIDAVCVATPDHMHFLPAYMAMLMGKHVFVEKPLTQTVWEARELLALARKTGLCTQMGNLGHSNEGVRRLKEWVQAGLIGSVREVHVWTNRPSWPQGMNFLPLPEPVPPGLDWDLYLGRSKVTGYNKGAYPYTWRGWRQFGTGALGDMGCHTLDGAFFALDLDAPTAVSATAQKPTEFCYPLQAVVTYEFPARGSRPPVTLRWYEGSASPPRPEELPTTRAMPESGHLFIGDKGKIMDSTDKCGSPRLLPDERMIALNKNPIPPTLPRIPEQDHYRNFLDAIRKNDPAAACANFEYSVPLTETVLLGNAAIFSKERRLEWDAGAMRFSNDDAANSLLQPAFRDGWTVADITKAAGLS